MYYNCIDTGETGNVYDEYLRTEHWRKFRETIYIERERKCQGCGCDLSTIRYNVHHKTYKRVGKEKKEDVLLWCETCHKAHHAKPTKKIVVGEMGKAGKIKRISGLCNQLTMDQIDYVLSIVEGFNSKSTQNTRTPKFKRIPKIH